MFSQYHVLERIGEGSFGKVRKIDVSLSSARRGPLRARLGARPPWGAEHKVAWSSFWLPMGWNYHGAAVHPIIISTIDAVSRPRSGGSGASTILRGACISRLFVDWVGPTELGCCALAEIISRT